jgi:hypothetical protein
MKKRLLAVLGLFAICKFGYSQTVVSYTYDAAGNRISRAVGKKVTRSISDEFAKDMEDNLSEKNLTVTERGGKITILVKELDPENPYEVSLYGANGILHYSKTIDANSTTISLLDYPTGTYILTIKYDEETTTYKFARK